MKKAIVTGANGFIGTWLVKELSCNGVQVYAVIKDHNEDISGIEHLNNVNIIYCDMANINTIENKISDRNIDCFYHLAWCGSSGALRADHVIQLDNVKYCCDAAYMADKLSCKKFLCAGTITENIADETFELENVSQNMMYGICKKTAHLILNAYCKKLGTDLIWMQFSNIYGPGDCTNNLINYTFKEFLKGNIPAFSKGSQPYDFIFVKDLVHAAYLLGENNVPADTYFLGSGDSKFLSEYLLQIPSILGENYKMGLGERPEDGLIYKKEWFDISKLKKYTGYFPKYTFEEGIKITFESMKEE